MLVRQVVAGAMAAVVTLAALPTLGLLAYAPMGAGAAGIGVPAACVTVTAGALAVGLLGRSVMPVAGLSSATTLIFAGLVAELAADPMLPTDATRLDVLVGVAACSVLMMGLWQLVFGLLRLGSLASFVPQPVLAGFMNGVALLIVWAQVPTLLGLSSAAWSAGSHELADWQPATLAVGLATAAACWIVARRWRRAPAALIGLVLGCALYAAIATLLPIVPLGPLAGEMPARLPLPDALLPLLPGGEAGPLLLRHVGTLILNGLLMAFIGSLETILNARATDQDRRTRHDPNRELLAFGAGNLVSALFGGLPVVYWRSRVITLQHFGGRTRIAVIACALATGALLLLATPLLALLPLAVLAGVMLTVAVALMDRWTPRLLRQGLGGESTRELWLNLAIVSAVCFVTLWRGFAAGVALGVLLAMVLFIDALHRSLVRSRFDAAAHPSRRVYTREQERCLGPLRREILVLELEGALFFGNADRLAVEAAGIDPVCRFLVLDFKRISTIDASGAMALAQLADACAYRGVRVMLAGIAPGHRHGRSLRALSARTPEGIDVGADWFVDADHAIEAAERHLLNEVGHGIADGEVTLESCGLMLGLDEPQRMLLRGALRARDLAAGELLFRQGDPGDCLYVLTRGSLTMRSRGDAANRLTQRFVSFSPGMMFGETAMLDGGGRTADAVADVPSRVHSLSRDALDALHIADPALCEQVYLNIARHLSERLRHAVNSWRAAA